MRHEGVGQLEARSYRILWLYDTPENPPVASFTARATTSSLTITTLDRRLGCLQVLHRIGSRPESNKAALLASRKKKRRNSRRGLPERPSTENFTILFLTYGEIIQGELQITHHRGTTGCTELKIRKRKELRGRKRGCAFLFEI